MDLVFTDQHHTARIDDVGGILDKIAAAALDFIVNLILMVDMEAGHLVTGITVDPVDEKVHMGRVDIFRNHTAAPDCRGALHPAFGSCSISKDSTNFAIFQTIFKLFLYKFSIIWGFTHENHACSFYVTQRGV